VVATHFRRQANEPPLTVQTDGAPYGTMVQGVFGTPLVTSVRVIEYLTDVHNIFVGPTLFSNLIAGPEVL